MSYVIGIVALFAAVFSLFAVLSVTTSAMRWRIARIYWICAVVATGALFGTGTTVIVAGGVVAIAILLLLLGTASFLAGRRNAQVLAHHNHSSH